jgi:hypothetical protein
MQFLFFKKHQLKEGQIKNIIASEFFYFLLFIFYKKKKRQK